MILFPSGSAMSVFLSVLLSENNRSTVFHQTQLSSDHFSLDTHPDMISMQMPPRVGEKYV